MPREGFPARGLHLTPIPGQFVSGLTNLSHLAIDTPASTRNRIRMNAPVPHRIPSTLPIPLRAVLLPLLLMPALAAAACGGASSDPVTPPIDPPAGDTAIAIPAQGTASTFDVATWNIEWFGDQGNGPQDEDFQLNRVRDVIRGADLELWGVQEVTGVAHFSRLIDSLPGYAGLLANDPSVDLGPAFYSDFGGNEQKVGLVYREDAVQVQAARIILTDFDYEFAGRPPLAVDVVISAGSGPVEATVIVLHAKASTDATSWERRQAASQALEAWLDLERPDTPVWVIGDFNDDLDQSISTGRSSPYANLDNGDDAWSFVTRALTDAGESSTTGYDDMIDHQLVSDEVLAWYVAGSADAFEADQFIVGYANNTSDHYPVIAHYLLP